MDPFIVLVVAGVTAVLALAGWVIFKAWPFVAKMSRFLDDVNGEPERTDVAGNVIADARPGLLARMASVEESSNRTVATVEKIDSDLTAVAGQVGLVRDQVKNSHVTNLRDDMDGIAERVTELAEKVQTKIEDLHEQYADKAEED